MINGSCHCGKVTWHFDGIPDSATVCNCTICRRSGALWGYDWEGERITTAGPTRYYVRGVDIEFHFCPECACTTWWRGARPEADGRRRIAVNLRLADPEPVAEIPIRHFDGFTTFTELPRDGRRVADYWI